MTPSPVPPLIFDSHLDLAWSAVVFNRDLTLEVADIRAAEAGMTDHPARGTNVLSLPELRRAGVAVCVATLLARSGPEQKPREKVLRTDLDYVTPALANAAAHAQLAWYRLMEEQGHVKILRRRGDLAAHWEAYAKAPATTPLGIILSMEGTDPITYPEQARQWHDAGLRAAGLAHYGRGQYAYGTAVEGPLSSAGIELLRVMDDLGMILDVTHLCDQSMKQALDYFDGPILASHHNCRALVPGDRQLTDEQIGAICKRGGVIGTALDAWMLYPGWVRQKTRPEVVSLAAVADHLDHVCQIAGDCAHAALGTDLDGGFGYEQTPRDLRIYSDLRALAPLLAGRGYSQADMENIFHGNWLTFFGRALPGE